MTAVTNETCFCDAACKESVLLLLVFYNSVPDVFAGSATRRSLVPCLCHGQHGAPGPTAALNVEEGSSQGLEPVRMGTAAQGVQR